MLKTMASKLSQLGLYPHVAKQFLPPPPGSVLYLPGYPPSTTVLTDHSGQANHGAITGATPVRLPSGQPALSFDGSTALVNCGTGSSLDFTTNLTAIAWINPSALTNNTIFGQLANQSIAIRVGSNALNAYTNWVTAGNDKSDSFTPAIVTNVWQMVAVTVDCSLANQNIKAFSNGVSGGTADRGAGDSLTASNTLYLGYFWGGFRFAGMMALPLLLNVTWSQNQIIDWYRQTRRLFGV